MPASDARDPTTRFVRPEDSLFAEAEGEIVMMSLESDRYYGLDAIGSRIWGMLEQPATVGDICTRLEAEYNVDPETCRADTTAFLKELVDANLVQALDP